MSEKNYLDKVGFIYQLTKLKNYITATYVQKDGNKVLSTNDYTTAEKTKLGGIEAQANKTIVDNALSSSSINPVENRVLNEALDGKQDTLTAGANIDITNGVISVSGAVNIDDTSTSQSSTWSSSKVNTELGNKQNALTAGAGVTIANDTISVDSEIDDSSTSSSTTWSSTKINAIVDALRNSRFAYVQALPTTDISTNTIYLVPKSTAGTNNACDEYIYVDNAWEKIGDTEIDLSGYVQDSDLVAITNAEIDTMFEIFE